MDDVLLNTKLSIHRAVHEEMSISDRLLFNILVEYRLFEWIVKIPTDHRARPDHAADVTSFLARLTWGEAC